MKISCVWVLNAKKLNLVLMIRETNEQVEEILHPPLHRRAAEYYTRYITSGVALRETSTSFYRKSG